MDGVCRRSCLNPRLREAEMDHDRRELSHFFLNFSAAPAELSGERTQTRHPGYNRKACPKVHSLECLKR
jgi:hypothetical protein